MEQTSYVADLNTLSVLVYIDITLQIGKTNGAETFKIHTEKNRLGPYPTPQRERKLSRCNDNLNMKNYANVIKYREYLYTNVREALLNHSQNQDTISVNVSR